MIPCVFHQIWVGADALPDEFRALQETWTRHHPDWELRLWTDANLPEGLVRVAHGGADVGIALAQAPVHKVLFTGSPAVGRVVARACVSGEKEVTLELGGKDAMLVLADARLQRAAAGAMWAGCVGAGQARGAVERVYVAHERFDRFLAELVAAAGALTVGDPADPRTQLGPLASARRVEHVGALVAEAVEQGARVHCGGPVSPADDELAKRRRARAAV